MNRIGSRTLPGTGSSNNNNAINSGENAAAAASKGRRDEKQRYVDARPVWECVGE